MIFSRALVLCFAITLAPLIAAGAELKVLTWNVYMLPQPIKNSLQHLRDEAIPELLSDSDYDVMFFQEAFTPSFRKAMIKKLSAAYPHQYYLKRSNAVFPVFGSGVFVMSRHPFSVIEKVRFKDCAGADCLAEKGTFLIELQLPSGKLIQFASTHLNSQSKNSAPRAGQLTQVRDMFARNKKRGVAQVFLGDLNISAAKDEFTNSLDLVGMKPVLLSGDTKTTNARVNECFKTPKSAAWIDHIWVDRDTTIAGSSMKVMPTDFVHNGKVCPLSDHHALEAHLSLN